MALILPANGDIILKVNDMHEVDNFSSLQTYDHILLDYWDGGGHNFSVNIRPTAHTELLGTNSKTLSGLSLIFWSVANSGFPPTPTLKMGIPARRSSSARFAGSVPIVFTPVPTTTTAGFVGAESN